MIAILVIARRRLDEVGRNRALAPRAAMAATGGQMREIQACLRRNRTTTSIRAIS
jgi:hypothetical protein